MFSKLGSRVEIQIVFLHKVNLGCVPLHDQAELVTSFVRPTEIHSGSSVQEMDQDRHLEKITTLAPVWEQ